MKRKQPKTKEESKMRSKMWKRNLAAVMTAAVGLARTGTSLPVFAEDDSKVSVSAAAAKRKKCSS